MKIIFTFLISLAFFTNVAAQQTQAQLDSLKSGFLTKSFLYEVLTHAKEHGVIVEFPTFSDKLEKLKQFTGPNADAERRRTEKTKLDMYEALQEAAQEFDFAELRMIPDTLMDAYYEGIEQPYFMEQYGTLRYGEMFKDNLIIYPVSDWTTYLKINDLRFYNENLEDILKTYWALNVLHRDNWLDRLLGIKQDHETLRQFRRINRYLNGKFKRLDRRYNK